MRGRQGFTLLELMISLVVLGLVTTYLTTMMIRQGRSYEVVDEVTEAQQNMRAIGDLLERELRSTGMLVAEGAAICGIDGDTGGNDILVVTDTDAINPTAGMSNPVTQMNDSRGGIDVTGGYSGSGSDTLNLRFATVDGVEFYDNDSPPDGTADSDFFVVGGTGQHGAVIVTDRDNPDHGVQCGMVTAISGADLTVDWTFGGSVPSAKVVPISTPIDLVAVPAHYYRIVGGAQPRLERDGMILADDVEALQVAYFHDADDDGQVDANEWSGVSGNAFAPATTDNAFLREVRVGFVVRTASQDADAVLDPSKHFGQPVQLENGPAPATTDAFRRRVYQRVVRPRNVGLRPGEEE